MTTAEVSLKGGKHCAPAPGSPGSALPDKMSTEDKFKAAVNVIKSLPKDGKRDAPFQPSDDLKLKFYAYYKQATEGPNRTSKPPFYDIVAKYKWNAWHQLGDMSREEAMTGYISELKKIVETMSLSEPVAGFYEVLGPFYEFVVLENKQDLSLNNGSAFPGQELDLASRQANALVKPNKKFNVENKGEDSRLVNGLGNGDINEGESDGDEFSDTYDHIADDPVPVSSQNGNRDEIISARGEAEITSTRIIPGTSGGRPASVRPQPGRGIANPGALPPSSLAGSGAGGSGHFTGREPVPEVNEQIALAVIRLQQSMEQVVSRLESIETRLVTVTGSNRSYREVPKWWPISGISPSTVFFVAWPFVAHYLIDYVRERRRNR